MKAVTTLHCTSEVITVSRVSRCECDNCRKRALKGAIHKRGHFTREDSLMSGPGGSVLVILAVGSSLQRTPGWDVYKAISWRHDPMFLLRLCVCLRVSGVQLLHSANEEDESELSKRWSHGHTFCQHEVSDPGEISCPNVSLCMCLWLTSVQTC